MSERKSEHPAVKIAGVVGGIIFVAVLMMVILAKEHLSVIGWIVIPLAVMGIALGRLRIAEERRGSNHRGGPPAFSFGGFVPGVAITSTGLGRRVADRRASRQAGSYTRIIAGMTMAGVASAFITPSPNPAIAGARRLMPALVASS